MKMSNVPSLKYVVNFDFRVDLFCFYFENMLHNFLLRKKWFLHVYLCIYFVSVVSIEFVSLNCKKWLKNNSKKREKDIDCWQQAFFIIEMELISIEEFHLKSFCWTETNKNFLFM